MLLSTSVNVRQGFEKVRDVAWGSEEKQKLLPPDTAIANGSSCMYKCSAK